ncbi:ASKHA domain-containing protein [Dehalococcoidia bacterium]|nr:ASKHA domain-containing protein [Dehalococcoidia bacterium]
MSPLYHLRETLNLQPGKTLFDYADALKLRVPTSCGRTGECHECIVEVTRGAEGLNDRLRTEGFLQDNYRLACQALIVDDSADVEFSVLRRQSRILVDSVHREFKADPLTTRQGDRVVFRGQAIDAYRGRILGLAIDIGTTTVVMNLVDLESAAVMHTTSFENPQRFGGSDTMHRITYDAGPNRDELRQVIVSAVNFEIGDMARHLKFHRRHIYEVVIVGNSTMRDLFFGLDVQPIGLKPYKSITETEMRSGSRGSTVLEMEASDLGLRIFPDAHVYGGPLVGSHVGADVAADLLAIAMDEQDNPVMLIDVGTNTEVVVGDRHRLMATSCPAGPAFEGGQVSYGMPGYEGAVESLSIDGTEVLIKTIGGHRPQGICGSGLVDLLAELKRTQQISELGVLKDGANNFVFEPTRGMSLSRADISSLAQAKSANFSGQYIVLRKYGMQLQQVSKLYLAGGFANYIDVDNAIDIGFIPNISRDRIVKVGNAALEGATIMLLSRTLRANVEDLVCNIEHVELETTPDFFDIFVEGCMFKPMTL